MSDALSLRGSHLPEGIATAREALVEWIRAGGDEGRRFLEVHLRHQGRGRFAVRHFDDRHRPMNELQLESDPYRAREIAQKTAEGAHRPLKTAPNLRRGWVFEGLDERALWVAMDYLYPACVGHWYSGREGTLRVTHWGETAGRQSGMYSSVRLLQEPAVHNAVRACCADVVCLRRVAWGLAQDRPEPLSAGDEPLGDLPEAEVPCPEACSMFISFARTVLTVERAPRSAIPGIGTLNALEIDQVRALVATATNEDGKLAREGEFDLPLNHRRLRYLGLRLAEEDAKNEST